MTRSSTSYKPVDPGPKLVSAERALAAIRAGSRIYIGTGCAAPRTLLARLEAMEPGPADLELVSFLTTSALPQAAGSPRTRHRHRAFFVGSDVRGLAGSGQLDYVPISLEEIPRLLTSGRLPIDVALLQVSSRLRQPRGVGGSCPRDLERRAHRDRGDQSSDAAHPWREPGSCQPICRASRGRFAYCGVCSS
jgi:acyl-CoA hydrolase